ncbi:hypothetical protein [Hyphomicrobium sp.]|uniref:hypothetical protein n=1 Tax=Hyphomicrobium sp. TaxID=82 RepID=UPI001D60B489|nr:hypothetical protein [Hyphomicrobium sp.]MBY0559910.1 hypothetical protein [Hyphomicrobium sp.]
MADIDRSFTRAPNHKNFRVVGVDTFSQDDWIADEFDTLAEAQVFVAKQTKGAQMLKMYIYDRDGKYVDCGGTY